jgi:four helix bundle protein
MGKKGFRELIVWQKAKDLAVTIYRVSEEGALSRDYGLRDQIRRSAVSVASNLAEGDERDTDKESVRFFLYRERITG